MSERRRRDAHSAFAAPWHASRREFLRCLGLSAAFLPSLRLGQAATRSGARAQRAEPLERLLIFFATQGTYWPNWQLNVPEHSQDVSWELALSTFPKDRFSPCLEPLYPIREQLLLLDGIALGLTGAFGRMEHNTGHAVALSGAKPTLDGIYVTRVAGPSIDQLVAEHQRRPGPVPSLQFGASPYPVSHDLRGLPLPSEADPIAAFGRLFPGAAPAGGQIDSKSRRAARISVLDLVLDQTKRLSRQLSAADRLKLDAHHSAIFDLEQKLRGLERITCENVTYPQSVPIDPLAWVDYYADTWADIAVLALTCGSSKVVTLYDPGPTCAYLGLPCTNLHMSYAHTAGMLPESSAVMTNFYRYYAERFRRLVERLGKMPDADGSLLDSTLVVMANELGQPNHDWEEYPMVLAGGGRQLRLGRYLHYAKEHTMKGLYHDVRVGPMHNRVLVSIAQAFGVDVQHVGETSLPDNAGTRFDITGPLSGLT